ncbi:aminoglycoside 2''-phosphotransferase [Scopulibacillus daqui]|uniref:Aminoglycoside 2''-phosphotransferase n=1 Tax=Scopulibacillus daqui TaxID=1469162 RepID=A0ABS2Q0V1_9BACL|nr:phosphotransferase [Scopulibacillus daqui]MBM7645929.1 aminoglycoside 2''-phosphotransferase [Scopulibacillus daqui]
MSYHPVVHERLQWISEQLPDLRIRKWKVDEQGWDNIVIMINDTWIFRFPRNVQVQKRLELEKQLLDKIKDPLTEINVEVPMYRLMYDSMGKLPVCSFYKMIKGIPLKSHLIQRLSPIKRHRMTDTLGEVLAIIHSFDIKQIDLKGLEEEHTQAYWEDHFSDIKQKVFPLLAEWEQVKVTQLFDTFLTKWHIADLPKTLIHGDLSHHHIIYSEDKQRISGIIDFGDAKIGDPAYDFSGLYWDYGKDFLLHTLKRYRHCIPMHVDICDMYERIVSFYGKRPIFNDILYGIEKHLSSYLEKKLNKLRRSLR